MLENTGGFVEFFPLKYNGMAYPDDLTAELLSIDNDTRSGVFCNVFIYTFIFHCI
jgi:hypothetical protein